MIWLSRWRRTAPTLVRVSLAELLAYRAELVIWFLAASMPAVMLLVWDRLAADAPIGRFDQARFAQYFVTALLVRQLTAAWVVWDLNAQIHSGEISPRLLKPLHPLVFDGAENLSAIPFRVVTLLPLLLFLAWWRPAVELPSSALVWGLTALSCMLGWSIQFAVQVAFGSLAFFFHQSIGLYTAWSGVFLLLSGFVMPIEVLPAPWDQVAAVLPFRAMVGTPTEIGAGLLPPAEAGSALLLQALWLGIAVLIARWVWTRGVRRYEAIGS